MKRFLNWKVTSLLLLAELTTLLVAYQPDSSGVKLADRILRDASASTLVAKRGDSPLTETTDPFAPRAEPPEVRAASNPIKDESRSPLIAGIFYDPNHPLASIDGKLRRTGDIVNGSKLLRIHPDSVVFEKNGREFERTISREAK